MPFPCFWKKSNSYNLTHEYDGIKKSIRTSSSLKPRVSVIPEEEYNGTRKTWVLRTKILEESLEDTTDYEYPEKLNNANSVKELPPEDDKKKSSEINSEIFINPSRDPEKTSEILQEHDTENNSSIIKDENSTEEIIDHHETIHNTTDNNPRNSSENKSSVTIIIDKVDVENTTKEIVQNENTQNDELKSEQLSPGEKIQESKNFLDVDPSVSRSSSLESIENKDSITDPNRPSVDSKSTDEKGEQIRRRSGVLPTPVRFNEEVAKSLVKYPKSESDEQFIKDAICKNEFLSKVITGRRLQDVVDAMYFKEIKAKEKVIKEGTRGSHMYVAAEGEFEVTKKGRGVVNVMKPGDVFGELAILYNAKRFASVKAMTPAKVWVIDGTVYQQLVKKSNLEEQEEIVSFLQNVPILNEAGLDVLKRVATLLKPEFFETGTVIVKEGDRGDKFYIIAAGSVTITQENSGFIGQLHKGQCFGEKALLSPITRQATITADDPGTDCLTLTQKHFVDNFGEFEDISKITMIPQEPKLIEDVKKITNEYSHLDLSEFKILKTLGVGGFGRVEFIQHKTNPSLTFALKCLKKYEMVQQEQQTHVINEMQIQMSCNSPFIIRLYKTFKDNKYIYFLMEVCLGGDLWSLLQRQPNKNFTDKGARFIAGCVLEALAYLHNQGFVYRDLKPENLLIDNNGYIKMTDFGFAKRLMPGTKSGTFAGTPEYLAPEIILNRGHDKAVDLWAFGIFIFELLNGKTPFRSNDPSYMKTYNNILNGLEVVDFATHNSVKAKSLITKLLKKIPSERLGIEDIRVHKWFSDFEWEKLRACKIVSPYKPKLSSNVDCRYIDHFRRDNDIPPDENSGWDEYF